MPFMTVSAEADRGLMLSECKRLCEAPRKLPQNPTKFQLWKHLRDEVLVRLLYESFARISELLRVDVRDIDLDNCSIHILHPKGKAVFRIVEGKRVHVDTIHRDRYAFFSNYSRDLLVRHLCRRKRGPLFVNSRKRRLSSRQAERVVDHHAREVGIQRVVGYTRNGRKVHLVTCKSLREAGERHTDVAGADRDATARIAGHTVQTKEKYYKKGNFEEDRRIVRENHPLMRQESGS